MGPVTAAQLNPSSLRCPKSGDCPCMAITRIPISGPSAILLIERGFKVSLRTVEYGTDFSSPAIASPVFQLQPMFRILGPSVKVDIGLYIGTK